MEIGGVKLRVFGMDMEDGAFEHSHGGDGIDALPEEMARIEIATHIGSGNGAQPEHRLRVVDDEPGMHFDGDLHAMVGGELCVFDPVGRDHFAPLPVEHLQVIGRPGAGHPVGSSGMGRIAGASGEIDHHGDAELFGKQDGLAAYLAVVLRMSLIGMQRVAMTTQGADADSVVGENLLELGEGRGIFEHREFAVRIAGIVSGGEFDGVDLERREFLENRGQRKLGQQGSKDSNAHDAFCLLGILS